MANEIIIADNFPDSNIGEQTFLTADLDAGQKVSNVENTDGLAALDFLLFGNKGAESSQINQIATAGITNLVITGVSNFVKKHYFNEPVFKIKSNQIKFYRAANVDGSIPDDGDFTILTTKTIEADQLYTEYTDEGGGSGYWYKYTFYNSETDNETPLADAIAVRGGNYGQYASVDEARNEAGFQNNRWITDQKIYAKLIQSQSEVNGSLVIGGYTLPLASVPQMVKNATLLLTAGYLLSMEYGPEHTGTNKDGQLKLKMARDILLRIEKGDLELVDDITNEPISQAQGVRGYPDDSAVDATPSEGRMFTTTMKF